MSGGNNTQNVLVAVQILEQLLASAGGLVGQIKQAQATGTDISDDQLNQMLADDKAARDQLLADVAASGSAPSAG